MYLANVAAFQTVPIPVASGEYIIGGYYSEGDGGGGTFIWVPVSITSGDGGMILDVYFGGLLENITVTLYSNQHHYEKP